MIKILKHEESLDDLIQVGDSFMQDLREGIGIRVNELLEENGIDPDDVENISSRVSVNITIKCKKEEDNA